MLPVNGFVDLILVIGFRLGVRCWVAAEPRLCSRRMPV
jgi:hypothetical protein